MSFKNYICVTCAQDFTRKYSAYRHNHVLHQDHGKVVRTLEYMIGRVTGDYIPADPVSFKRERRQRITGGGTSNGFPFTSIAHDNFGAHNLKQTRQQENHKPTQDLGEPNKEYPTDRSVDTRSSKIAEIKSLCMSSFSQPFRDTIFQNIENDIINHEGNESYLDDYLRSLRSVKARFQWDPEIPEKPGTWKVFRSPHPHLFDLPLEAKTKLGKIESLMLRSINEVTVWDEIERLGKEFRNTGDWNILNVAIERYNRMATS
ncbi:MAG TPA: hypothetical protein VE504_01855 [Nitrososphaeraceae archaeon]|nr:hypothetical protein [Nitrososphaeraceae archaeon]